MLLKKLHLKLLCNENMFLNVLCNEYINNNEMAESMK